MLPRLIGVVHLGPLPGSPRFRGDFSSVLDGAAADARLLADAGFDGVMVENFGDAPFDADDVPKVTIAAMTAAVGEVAEACQLPTGVNVLRNDAVGALSVAAATSASYIRVNVLSGTMFTDQGPIVGRAAEVSRLRAHLCPDVSIMADVFVKHATPPPGLHLVDATRDLTERAGADAVIVTGSGTGAATNIVELRAVCEASNLPVYVGSGATASTIAELLAIADGAIVGTATKEDGVTTNRVDVDRAGAIVAAASE
ncbi:MAG: BtpA/SgcQ family protein [Acidimicrobiia bacterium]